MPSSSRALPSVFTPGPTALHPLAGPELAAMVAEGYLSEHHRGPVVRRWIQRMDEALRALLGIPEGYEILLVGSATEAMERIVGGVAPTASHHRVAGAFGARFREVARAMGVPGEDAEVPDGSTFPPGATALPAGTELLALTQNETSTGARLPPSTVEAMARAARGAGALVAVDLVSGWPSEPVDPAWVDAGFFSVQKGFGLPPGMGVIVASPALLERAKGDPRGGWIHLSRLAEAARRLETAVTPNTLAIRLLARVAERYLEAGGQPALARQAEARVSRWWKGVDRVNRILEGRAAGGAFRSSSPSSWRLRPFVSDPDARSRTVSAVVVEGPPSVRRPATPWVRALADRGFRVGSGYGRWEGIHLRIAHYPVQEGEAQEALLQAMMEVASMVSASGEEFGGVEVSS